MSSIEMLGQPSYWIAILWPEIKLEIQTTHHLESVWSEGANCTSGGAFTLSIWSETIGVAGWHRGFKEGVCSVKLCRQPRSGQYDMKETFAQPAKCLPHDRGNVCPAARVRRLCQLVDKTGALSCATLQQSWLFQQSYCIIWPDLMWRPHVEGSTPALY